MARNPILRALERWHYYRCTELGQRSEAINELCEVEGDRTQKINLIKGLQSDLFTDMDRKEAERGGMTLEQYYDEDYGYDPDKHSSWGD